MAGQGEPKPPEPRSAPPTGGMAAPEGGGEGGATASVSERRSEGEGGGPRAVSSQKGGRAPLELPCMLVWAPRIPDKPFLGVEV